MYKSFGTWSWPSDPEAFEEHYWNVHIPIARSLPGLEALSTIKADQSGRASGIYRYAELVFADEDACERAMASPEGVAMVQDASGLVERFDVEIRGAMGWEDEPRR
jgi:uncharacterized protein (TIGR02118 family)